MLKLAGELLEGQLADHMAKLDAHIFDVQHTLVTGQYYVGQPCRKSTTRTVTADHLYSNPFIVSRAMTFDRIAIRVNSAASSGKKARLGIYQDNGSGYPSDLVLDASEVPIDSTGVKEITIDQSLTRGLYWVCFVCQEDFGIYAFFSFVTILGYSTSSFVDHYNHYDGSFSYAVLPDPHPSGHSKSENNNQEFFPVLMRLKSLD